VRTAQALPSFARQTGQPCGTCHTDFAGLTPFGRRFKIGGYTYGGGAYRTALFPSSDDSTDGKEKKWVPPISMMAITGFTNTQAGMGAEFPFRDHQNMVGVIFVGTEGYMIIPDYSSWNGLERSQYLPDSTYLALAGGVLGYRRVGYFRTRPLAGFRIDLLPIVNPQVQVFARPGMLSGPPVEVLR